LKKRKDIEFGVVTIKTTGGRPIANYTMTAANQRGVKGAYGGILLLVAVDDRQYQFSTSRQLEDKLPHDLLIILHFSPEKLPRWQPLVQWLQQKQTNNYMSSATEHGLGCAPPGA
jgi:hypothetical protein